MGEKLLPHLYNKLGIFKAYVRLRKLYKNMCRSLILRKYNPCTKI